MKSVLLLVAAAWSASLPAAAAAVGDALQRPALTVTAPHRAVLVSAALAGDRIVAVGERGIVALSDDRGTTWRQAPCPVSVTLTMVRFADAHHGVAVGHGGTVLSTSDAGASWTVRLDGRRLAPLARKAAATPDAIKEAERLAADGPDKPFLDVLMWDEKRLLAVGAYGLAFHSADGGVSWTPWMARLPNPKALHWYVARHAGKALMLAGEQGLVVRSDDGGETFAPMVSPYKGSWFTGALKEDGNLLLAGLRGNVWRSSDGGATWAQMASPIPASITAAADADGTLLLASQSGIVMALRGDALVPVNTSPVPMPAALLALKGGPVLTFGVAGALPLAARAKP